MNLIKYLNPVIVYSVILIIVNISLIGTKLKILNSYKLNYRDISVIGILALTIYYILPILIGLIFEQNNKINKVKINVKRKKTAHRIVYFNIIICFIGILGLIKHMLGIYSIFDILTKSFTGELKYLLNTGNGFMFFIIFTHIAIILFAILYDSFTKKKRCFILTIIFSIMFMYSSITMSRIIILEGVIFFGIIRLRLIRKKFSITKISIIFIIIGSFLIYTQGVRDFKYEGYLYTNSKIEWGITRLNDYVLSTNYYTDNILNSDYDKTFPNFTIPSINRFGNQKTNLNGIILNEVGSSEYTNLGGLGSLYLDVGIGFVVIILVISFLGIILWRSFKKGRITGIIFYPIMLFNILESYRIFFLGTELIQITILFLVFNIILLKRCIEVEII